MYAIIEVGAKQYTVKEGDVIEVEKLEAEDGKKVSIKEVLLCSKDGDVDFGKPYLKGITVEAEVLKQTKAPKLVSYKYRRRKASHWKKGHRQKLTVLKVIKIKAS